MRFYDLFEAMSYQQAAEIFKKYGKKLGITEPSTDLGELQKQRNTLVKKHHTDIGGKKDVIQDINAAYDVLKLGNAAPTNPRNEPKDKDAAIWSRAGYSGGMPNSSNIFRQNYTDMNYIKKRMWELSDHSTTEWTITGFDGYFSRASVTVYGSPAIFEEMAKAMVMWQSKGGNPYHCEAVYVQKRRSDEPIVYVIWAHGISYAADPKPLEYDSFNKNPSNDRSFERRLKELIDELGTPRGT